MTQSPDKPSDALLERYAEAVAQDPRKPSERVRNAARAHAQMLRDQSAETLREQGVTATKTAANHPHWTLALVASLAVVGLAGLLYVQMDRGDTQDRQIALGSAAHSDLPAQTAATGPAAPNTATPTKVVNPPAATTPAAAPALPPAPPPAQAVAMADASTARNDVPAPAAEAAVAARSVDAAPAPRMEARTAVATAGVAPAAPAMAAPVAPATLFLDAARNGNTQALRRLVAQGVAVDARDGAANTALLLAVRQRQAAAVRTLLELGADRHLTNRDGIDALQLAQQLGFAELVQLLQTPAQTTP